MPATYIRKDGTTVRYETKTYDDEYRQRHREEPYWCQSCHKLIYALNANRHNQTPYHIKRAARTAKQVEPVVVNEPEPEPVVVNEPVPRELKDSLVKDIVMTVKEMKAKAKELNLKGYSKLTKPQLEELLAKGSIAAKETVAELEPKEPMAKEEPAKAKKGKSAWNTFLTEYRLANGVSLKEAMKAKAAFAEWKAKQAK